MKKPSKREGFTLAGAIAVAVAVCELVAQLN